MKLHLFAGVGLVVALAGVARAEDQTTGGASEFPAGATFGIQRVDPSLVDAIPRSDIALATPPSRIIYLNRCANGCTVHPGNESSINQTSSILNQTANLSAYSFGDSEWNALVQCVRTSYARFDVTVTDQDPGNVAHWEEI